MSTHRDALREAQSLAQHGYGWEDIRYLCKVPERIARAIVTAEAERAALSTLRRRDRGIQAEAQAEIGSSAQAVLRDDPGGALALAGAPQVPADE